MLIPQHAGLLVAVELITARFANITIVCIIDIVLLFQHHVNTYLQCVLVTLL